MVHHLQAPLRLSAPQHNLEMVRHALLIPFYAWGHLRPESALAVTLARRYADLVICKMSFPSQPLKHPAYFAARQAFLCEVDFVKRAKDEMSRQCTTEEERATLLPRIRVIAYGSPQPELTPEMRMMLAQLDPRHVQIPARKACADAVKLIGKIMDELVFVDNLGTQWSRVGAVPKLVITDILMGNVTVPVKEKYNLRVYLWWFGNIASFTRCVLLIH
ncbi:glycosyltransferase family 1 protein [Calocera cornea HHB12733]|uniref:Glycosyltransferase family 1 protein n=1 Tax=Calocera cornea HHB12733 TaxID=1353952 RepID=A0A165F5E4_9BASI|nr:glycosyltransferase family 1 protein [Calocera cornea HHB12733]